MTNERAITIVDDVNAYLASRSIYENDSIAEHTYRDICEALTQLKQSALKSSMPPVIPQKMQGKWIPTTERLPDNNQTEYLVTYKRKGKLWINIGFCDDGDWYLYSNDEGPNWEPYVIAWMPLPEPYKREDDEE